ncbi:Conserved protein of uncharacterised function, PE family protein (fragment) [Mycobacterium tuberculosis]
MGALGTVRGLQDSNTAFVGALHSGNLLGATGAVLQAPGNAVNGFLFGQTSISQSIDVSPEYGYELVLSATRLAELLAPLEPVTVTFTPTFGEPDMVHLSGTKFGGLVPALFEGVRAGF